MAGTRIYLNNVSTKITAQLLTGGTTVNVTAGDGALFAAANGTTGHIVATLRRTSGYKDVAREIVDITNRSTDALTITRAQESTTALQFEIGDQLDCDFTAASLSVLEAAWTAYTPTVTAASGTFTTVSATGKYRMTGKTVQFQAAITITTVGTAASLMIVTFPVTASTGVFAFSAKETTVTGTSFAAATLNTTQFSVQKYDGTFGIASGYGVIVSGTYEAA